MVGRTPKTELIYLPSKPALLIIQLFTTMETLSLDIFKSGWLFFFFTLNNLDYLKIIWVTFFYFLFLFLVTERSFSVLSLRVVLSPHGARLSSGLGNVLRLRILSPGFFPTPLWYWSNPLSVVEDFPLCHPLPFSIETRWNLSQPASQTETFLLCCFLPHSLVFSPFRS